MSDLDDINAFVVDLRDVQVPRLATAFADLHAQIDALVAQVAAGSPVTAQQLADAQSAPTTAPKRPRACAQTTLSVGA